MAWIAPRTWVTGEVVTAALMNTHVRDNTRYLKGLDGVPTVESGLTIDNFDGDERLLLPLLSTAECSTVLNAEGEVAFDEQTHRPKYFNGTSVISEGDAATLFIASQAQGDVIYASSATAFARLGPGTSGQFLKTQGAAANPVWATSTLMSTTVIPIFWSGLAESVSGGTVTQNGVAVVVASGGTNTNYALVYSTTDSATIGAICDKNPVYELVFKLSEVTASDMVFIIGVGYAAIPADGASANKYFGFYVTNGALWASSGDGTNRSSQNLATALSANTRYRVKQQLVSGALHTWVDGVAKTDKTTNLPTGTITSALVSLSAYRTTATLTVNANAFLFEHDL